MFPKLKNLTVGPKNPAGALVRSVFEDAYNYMKTGTLIRQVINKLNEDIDFNDSKNRHLLGDVYEKILKDLQSAGNAGEYYTPRAVTRFVVDMVNPQLGEQILERRCAAACRPRRRSTACSTTKPGGQRRRQASSGPCSSRRRRPPCDKRAYASVTTPWPCTSRWNARSRLPLAW